MIIPVFGGIFQRVEDSDKRLCFQQSNAKWSRHLKCISLCYNVISSVLLVLLTSTTDHWCTIYSAFICSVNIDSSLMLLSHWSISSDSTKAMLTVFDLMRWCISNNYGNFFGFSLEDSNCPVWLTRITDLQYLCFMKTVPWLRVCSCLARFCLQPTPLPY